MVGGCVRPGGASAVERSLSEWKTTIVWWADAEFCESRYWIWDVSRDRWLSGGQPLSPQLNASSALLFFPFLQVHVELKPPINTNRGFQGARAVARDSHARLSCYKVCSEARVPITPHLVRPIRLE